MTLSHHLYNLLVRAATPLLRRKLVLRSKAEPLYGERIAERFGDYSQQTVEGLSADSTPLTEDQESAAPVWLHAVSYGETRAAAVLLQALRKGHPHLRFILTHGTATGRAEGVSLLCAGDQLVWQPWDTPQAIAAFLQQFKPRLGLLMETEVWPNWVRQCQLAQMPLVLVNARMSEKSMHRALYWASLMRPAYAGLTAALAQSPADAERLTALGACVTRITGNLKFDAEPNGAQRAQGQAWRLLGTRPVVMLASTRETEEAMWLETLRAHTGPALPVQWLIVPRHPQRFDTVQKILEQAGYRVSRRSQWGENPPWHQLSDAQSKPEQETVWLGDSMGEMALYYSLADCAWLGGSFAPLGGQNLIEAAACACPVICGPHTYNFAQASETAIAAGAAVRVIDMQQALRQTEVWAQSKEELTRRRASSLSFAQAHRGACENTVSALQLWLG